MTKNTTTAAHAATTGATCPTIGNAKRHTVEDFYPSPDEVAEDELGCHPSEHRDGSRYYAGALNPASHE